MGWRPSADGRMTIGDAITLIRHLFRSGSLRCRDAADANDDGTVDIADPVHILRYLFLAGPAPGDPGPPGSRGAPLPPAPAA